MRSSNRFDAAEAVPYPILALLGAAARAFRPKPEGLDRLMISTSGYHPQVF
jgi:hypothetical protein